MKISLSSEVDFLKKNWCNTFYVHLDTYHFKSEEDGLPWLQAQLLKSQLAANVE